MNSRELCTYVGLLGGTIAGMFGGWDTALQTLIIFMSIDYITGLIVAGVFHTSPKTKTGTLESRAGWKGLVSQGRELAGGAGGVPTGRHHRKQLHPGRHRDRLRVQRNHLHHRERRTHGRAYPGSADQGGGCAEAEGGEKRRIIYRTQQPHLPENIRDGGAVFYFDTFRHIATHSSASDTIQHFSAKVESKGCVKYAYRANRNLEP